MLLQNSDELASQSRLAPKQLSAAQRMPKITLSDHNNLDSWKLQEPGMRKTSGGQSGFDIGPDLHQQPLETTDVRSNKQQVGGLTLSHRRLTRRE